MSQSNFIADLPGSDQPSPPDVFFNRRDFVKTAAVAGLIAAPQFGMTSPQDKGKPRLPGSPRTPLDLPLQWPEGFSFTREDSYKLPENINHSLTPRIDAATHNNYYEFLMGRGGPVWKFTEKFEVTPWTIEVSGECNQPQTFDLDDLFAFAHEERLYHFRCVERWAMNIPWTGFPLSRLLEKVQPNGHAKFVRFLTAHRPEQMPSLQRDAGRGFQWPYFEGLRLDEAMNELTLLATGVYGEPLLKQHGAPIRLVVPWKYGYKNPKSIVKIELLREQPKTFWGSGRYKHEYGFLSNVNPNIPHPRWSQARSFWLDTREKFDTPIFNGYGKYVAALYPDEPRSPQKPLKPREIAR